MKGRSAPSPPAVGSRPRTEIRETPDSVLVDGLKRVQKANGLRLGERDPSLVDKHISCAISRGAPKEVAKRFAYCRGSSLVDRSLLVGESEFKSLCTHDAKCTDDVRSFKRMEVILDSPRSQPNTVALSHAPFPMLTEPPKGTFMLRNQQSWASRLVADAPASGRGRPEGESDRCTGCEPSAQLRSRCGELEVCVVKEK